MPWAFSRSWYVCSAFNRDRNRPQAASSMVFRGRATVLRAYASKQPPPAPGGRDACVCSEQKRRKDPFRTIVSRDPRARFVRPATRAKRISTVFAAYRFTVPVLTFVAEATLLVALVPRCGWQRRRTQPRKRGHARAPQPTSTRQSRLLGSR